MNAYLRLTITDTLGVLMDGNHACSALARATRMFWYRLPGDWVRAGRLTPQRRDQLIGLLYGTDGRCGDRVGVRYVILEVSEQVLPAEQVPARPWLGDRAACYAWREGDVIEKVIPARL